MSTPIKADAYPASVVKVTQIGSSSGIVLPKDILAVLGVAKGDSVTFRKTSTGVEIVKHDPEFEEEMRYAREAMDRYHETLKELAK